MTRGSRRAVIAVLAAVLIAASLAACKELPKIQPPSLEVFNPAPALTALLDRRAGAPR